MSGRGAERSCNVHICGRLEELFATLEKHRERGSRQTRIAKVQLMVYRVIRAARCRSEYPDRWHSRGSHKECLDTVRERAANHFRARREIVLQKEARRQ